jgi:hypothetical protein
MRTMELSNARGSLAKYARELQQDSVILTIGDKPIAALVPLLDADWESIRVSTDPRFIRILEESRRSLREEGGLSPKQVRNQLGLKTRKRRK